MTLLDFAARAIKYFFQITVGKNIDEGLNLELYINKNHKKWFCEMFWTTICMKERRKCNNYVYPVFNIYFTQTHTIHTMQVK
jgi:hypothetical protein